MDKKERELTKNTIIIFASKFCTQFLSFFLLPLLTAFLTTEEYGAFDLITTSALLLAPFMTIQLENGIFRFLIDERGNKINEKKILSSGIICILIQLVIFSIVYVIICNIVKINFYIQIYFYAISCIFLSILSQIARGLGDNISYAISSIFVGVTNVIGCFIFIYFFKMGLKGIVIAGGISNSIGAIYILINKKILNYLKISYFNKRDIINLIRYSLPLIPNSLSSWFISISDKVMISYLIGNSANGIYSISTKFSILMSHIFSVFNLSWTESASINAKDCEKEKFFSNVIDNIFKICSCLCLIIIAAMPIIFRIMINNSFNEAYVYIPLLMIATNFEILSGLLGAIYISLKLSKNIAITTLIAGIVNVIINAIFLIRYGIIVACISTIVSYVLVTIYRIFDLKKHINIKFRKKTYICQIIMMSILIFLYYKNSILISIFSLIITLVYCIYMNKSYINYSFNILKKIANINQ